MSEKNDGIIISSRGVNGSTVYSAFTEKSRAPIIEGENLKEFSSSIIKRYPEQAKEIKKYLDSGFSGELPKGINMGSLERPHKARLLQQIGDEMSYLSTSSNKK